jgi:hypothetical protein
LRGRVSLGAALFFVLLAAALVTSVLVVRARTPDLVLEVLRPSVNERVRFSPAGGPLPRRVAIEFFVRESDPGALVGIVDRREDLVRTLDADLVLSADDPVVYKWDGRTDAGAIAPAGRYRLLVELPSQDREMVFPRRFTLVPGRAD